MTQITTMAWSLIRAKYPGVWSQVGFRKHYCEHIWLVHLDLEKAEESAIKLPTILGSWRKQGNSKNINFCFTECDKAFMWITTNHGKFLKEWEYQITLPVSWETCKQVKKQQLALDMEQLTGSKLGKHDKVVHCLPAYLTYMQSTSWEMPGWITHKLESRLLGGISTTSDM